MNDQRKKELGLVRSPRLYIPHIGITFILFRRVILACLAHLIKELEEACLHSLVNKLATS